MRSGPVGWDLLRKRPSQKVAHDSVLLVLRRVEEEVLRDHVAHCVEHAISSGDKADQRRKITELMDVIGRADR